MLDINGNLNMKIKIIKTPNNNNKFSLGGTFSNGVTQINEGGSHSENPYEGIQVGIDPEGIPNLVEEGEIIWNDYVFSDRLKVPKDVKERMKLHGGKDMTFADAAKEITKMSKEMPNDPIVKRTMEVRLNELMQEQEMVRMKEQEKRNKYSKGGKVNKFDVGSTMRTIGLATEFGAPFLGNLTANILEWSGANDIERKPLNEYKNAINKSYNPVQAETLSDYISPEIYDTATPLNRLAAMDAATRNTLAQTTNNSAALRAAIVANDYNKGNQIGNLYRTAKEYNDAQRKEAANFNRATNQYNADARSKAAQFNAQLAANKADALYKAGQWEQSIEMADKARAGETFNALVRDISEGARSLYNEGMLRTGKEMGVFIDPTTGTVHNIPSRFTDNDLQTMYTEYNSSDDPNDQRLAGIIKGVAESRGIALKALGGKINRNKKKRRLS